MTAMDPKTGKMVTISNPEPGQVIDAQERFAMKRLADESRRNVDRLARHIERVNTLARQTYPQRDSGDETSYEGC